MNTSFLIVKILYYLYMQAILRPSLLTLFLCAMYSILVFANTKW